MTSKLMLSQHRTQKIPSIEVGTQLSSAVELF